ncbi:hypothetical protein [Nostoc sp. CCY0012]
MASSQDGRSPHQQLRFAAESSPVAGFLVAEKKSMKNLSGIGDR